MKVVFITSGQPSLNPRLIKEADALTIAGFSVTILYCYWNAWAAKYEEKLFAEKKWKAIRIAGDPVQNPFNYFISRLVYKVIFKLSKFSNGSIFAAQASARGSIFLEHHAKKIKADLYIAHNLGALPAAVKAAAVNKGKVGFDAEDFHRNEVTNDQSSYDYKMKKAVEDKYLPLVDQFTASSPHIAAQYKKLYPQLKPVTVLNVFPQINLNDGVKDTDTRQPVKLFWFSQTVGPKRGLENIIRALPLLSNQQYIIHLLGDVVTGYKETLLNLAKSLNIPADKILFYAPVSPDELFNVVQQFDIGIASEPSFSINNDIALSNKLFTYIQCGLAVVASDTTAQRDFLQEYSGAGKLYTKDDASSAAAAINYYLENRQALHETQQANRKLGQTTLNWEIESDKFLSLVNKTLGVE